MNVYVKFELNVQLPTLNVQLSTENQRRHMKIPLSQPDITQREIDAVVDVLHTTTLSIGPKLDLFEQSCARLAGRRHGIGVSSGTAGLHCAMVAAGVKEGDEVITTPFSFVASANCILYVGATPVFVDIDPQTLNMDVAGVAGAITPKTKAIVAVETFGHPGGMIELEQLAQKHELVLSKTAAKDSADASANGPSAPSDAPASSPSIPTSRSPPAKEA